MLRFITADVCPFAHRAWLVLLESGASFEKVDVTLKAGQKEPHFTSLYIRSLGANEGSDGKVPIIEDNGFVLCESAVVASYVDEVYFQSKLSGKNAKDRARIAIFNDQIGSRIMMKFYPYLMTVEAEAQNKAKNDFESALTALEGALGQCGGPFVLGELPSLADTNLWPFLLRAEIVLGHYRNWKLDTERYSNVAKYMSAMRTLKCVKESTVDPNVFISGYEDYANGKK
jgi:glutathione S-transferase